MEDIVLQNRRAITAKKTASWVRNRIAVNMVTFYKRRTTTVKYASTWSTAVIVNGVVVVKDSGVLPVKAGQEIRFPVEAKGRFTPVDKDKWMMEHTIGVNPGLSNIHVDDDSGAGVLLNKKE